MRPNLRRLSASASALALLGLALPARAQECVGLPSGRGILSLGVEGTDGASGPGVSFAYQTPGASLQLQHRSLDAFAQQDEISTSEVQAAVPLPRVRLPLCVTAGAQWTHYEYSEHAGTQYSPRLRTESYTIGGGYHACACRWASAWVARSTSEVGCRWCPTCRARWCGSASG